MAKEAPKYGIDKLATDLGIQPASVRVALRKHKIKKNGKSYAWTNKTEYEAVRNQLAKAAE